MENKKKYPIIKSFIITFITILFLDFTISYILNNNSISRANTLTSDCEVRSVDAIIINKCAELKIAEMTEYRSSYKSVEDCNRAEKKNLCIFIIARYTNNVSACYSNVEGYTERDLCVHNMAVIQRNITLCDYFNDECKSICKLNVNSTIYADTKGYNSVIGDSPCFTEPNETFCVFRRCQQTLNP